MSNKGKGPTEDEFLAHEAEIAKAALGEVKTELIESLKAAADPKAWAEKYPLPALGTAAAGGFAAAAAVKPMIFGSKDHHGNGRAAGGHASRKSSNWSKMLAPLMNVAKSSIKSAIIAGITAKAATDATQEDTPPESPADAAGSQHAAAASSSAL